MRTLLPRPPILKPRPQRRAPRVRAEPPNRAPRALIKLSALLLLSLASLGCDRERELTLTDTEGRRFHASCEGSVCQLEQASGDSPAGLPSLLLSAPGRTVAICHVEAGQAAPVDSADCRALVCQADADCPPLEGQPEGTCINRLCISTTGDVLVEDAVWMCLAGTGLGRSAPKQVGLYAMARNCGTPCAVPAPCRQP